MPKHHFHSMPVALMNLQVECSTAPNGDSEPSAIHLGDRRIQVPRIVDRWLASDYGYYKIEASDGATYIVRHDEASSEWQLTLFKAPGVA